MQHIDDLILTLLEITKGDDSPGLKGDRMKVCIEGFIHEVVDVKLNIEQTSLNEEDRKKRHAALVVSSGLSLFLKLLMLRK